jgi:hypothetical protein
VKCASVHHKSPTCNASEVHDSEMQIAPYRE